MEDKTTDFKIEISPDRLSVSLTCLVDKDFIEDLVLDIIDHLKDKQIVNSPSVDELRCKLLEAAATDSMLEGLVILNCWVCKSRQ